MFLLLCEISMSNCVAVPISFEQQCLRKNRKRCMHPIRSNCFRIVVFAPMKYNSADTPVTKSIHREIKCCSTVEPVIGHLK